MAVSIERERRQTYDPLFFGKVATDQDLFRQLLPYEVEEFINNPPEPLSLLDELIGEEDSWEKEKFYQDTFHLWKYGILRLQDFIYRKYAAKAGLFTVQGEPSKSLHMLSDIEWRYWNNWLQKTEFGREDVITSLKRLGVSNSFLKIPRLVRKDNDERYPLYETISKTPYKLTASFLPDLTDKEALILFNIFDAENILRLAF